MYSDFLNKYLTLLLVFLIFVTGIYFCITINPHSISAFVAGIGNLFLAGFVYSKDRKNTVNRTFALSTLFLAIFCFDLLVLYIASNEDFVIQWVTIFRTGFLLLPPSFLLFILTLTKDENKNNKKILYLSYLICLFFILLNVTGKFSEYYIKSEWKYSPTGGVVYTAFILNLLFFMWYSLFVLYHCYIRTKSNLERNQLRYVFIGAIIAIIIGATNLFLSYGIKTYPFGSLGYIAYSGIVAYAIVKHHLMDITVIIRKSIIYTTLTLSVLGIYALIVGISTSIFGENTIINGLAGLIVAVIFLPIKDKIQFIVDKLFFRDKYDYQKTLKNLSGELTTILELDKLLAFLVTRVIEIMHIERGYIMLYDVDREKYFTKFSKGIEPEVLNQIKLNQIANFIVWLEENKKILILDEHRDKFKELKEQKLCLCVPLMSKNKLIGVFNLGSKLSEEAYITEDMELLTTIANQAAIAIENAQLSSEMRTLEKGLLHMDKLSALGTLASSIAHEIKNPLVSIKTFCQLVSQKVNDVKFFEKFNSIIPQEIERMEHVLGQLLDFRKFSELELGRVNINRLIDDLLDLLCYEAYKQNIDIIRNYKNDLPLINAAEEHLKQVFMNLIFNAIHSMPNGGMIKITTSVSAEPLTTASMEDDKLRSAKESEDNVLPLQFVAVNVSDTGCGMSEETLKKIFTPFYTTKPSGTGLGLSITKRIIKEHNGSIGVSSELNKGTTFTVNLPVK